MQPESRAARRKRERASANGGRLSDSDFMSPENISPEEEVAIKADLTTPASSPQLTALDGGGVPAPAKDPTPETPTVDKDKPSPKKAEKKPVESAPLAWLNRKPPLEVFSISTSGQLWRRYEELAVEMTEAGRRTSVSEVMRLVLKKELPDLETDAGKQEAYGLAVQWAEKTQPGDRKVTAVRLRLPMLASIRRLCQEARRSGASLGPSGIISGVLDKSRLDARQIARIEE